MKPDGISKIGKELKRGEKTIGNEVKREEKAIEWFVKSYTFKILISTVAFIIIVFGIVYMTESHGRIYVEDSEIYAPVITLSPANPGILEEVFVKEGDFVSQNMIVAQISGIPIKAETDGRIISVLDVPGQVVNSQTAIVKMIDPRKIRVVGHLEEDKGLKDVQVGQNVIFTADAFGSKEYKGIVDSIAPSARQGDLVFSISNKRELKDFDISVKFDVSSYSELKNGMSAKMWIYK